MPIRWIVSPVALRTLTYVDAETLETVIEEVVCPKEHTYLDPGRGKRYMRSSLITADTWGLSFVRGVDFTPLDADPEIVNLFEGEFSEADDHLNRTPDSLGWNPGRLARLRGRLNAKGASTVGLTGTTPLQSWLERLGRVLDPNFDPRRYWVAGP